MAKEFGTTAPVMQGMKSSFEEAGVSGAGFERLVNRMSRQVATDYPDMMRNVSESNLRSQKSALGLEEAQHAVQKSFEGNGPEQATQRLQEAQEKLQESYGVPKEAFAAQDKLRDRRKDQLAVATIGALGAATCGQYPYFLRARIQRGAFLATLAAS